jgi:hypothetical protein
LLIAPGVAGIGEDVIQPLPCGLLNAIVNHL